MCPSLGTCGDRQSVLGTSADVESCLLEARFARAEGVCAVGDAVGLVSGPTLSPVTPAVIQLGV